MKGEIILLELLWELSKDKIVGIIVLMFFNVISPFINLINEKKWKCKKNKCDYDMFMWHQLMIFSTVLVLGIVTAVVGSLACTYFKVEFAKAINGVRWSVSIICACTLIFLYFVTRKQIKKSFDNIYFKGVNIVRKILYFLPMVYCFWIWNIALHIDAGIFNYIFNIIFILYNIIALIIFSHKEIYKYKYAKLQFKNRCISDVPIEDMSQNDEWIIIRKEDKEERFRYSALEDIEYYNTSEVEQKILEGINITKN